MGHRMIFNALLLGETFYLFNFISCTLVWMFQILWNISYKQLWPVMWVLGNEPRSSERAARALNQSHLASPWQSILISKYIEHESVRTSDTIAITGKRRNTIFSKWSEMTYTIQEVLLHRIIYTHLNIHLRDIFWQELICFLKIILKDAQGLLWENILPIILEYWH